jgi:hypothetical protein
MGVLRDRMATELRLRGMSPVTQRMYLACVRRFAAYHHRSPEALGEPEVRAFLDHLLRDRRMREDKGGFKRATCRFSLPVLRKAWLPAGCPSRKKVVHVGERLEVTIDVWSHGFTTRSAGAIAAPPRRACDASD